MEWFISFKSRVQVTFCYKSVRRFGTQKMCIITLIRKNDLQNEDITETVLGKIDSWSRFPFGVNHIPCVFGDNIIQYHCWHFIRDNIKESLPIYHALSRLYATLRTWKWFSDNSSWNRERLLGKAWANMEVETHETHPERELIPHTWIRGC